TATSFQRCIPQTFSIKPAAGATDYVWTVANGAEITSGQGTVTVTIDFSAVLGTLASTKVTAQAANACGVATAVKILTLSSAACAAKMVETPAVAATAFSVYPNPATSEFNVDVTAVEGGAYTMSIYTVTGSVVSSRTINVAEGMNTVNENISGLTNGIYFVQFVNQTTNETIVKKLVKR
ncbi:MAG: hypothetical protein RL427_1826, partial [Bacteroidota bacterium]